MRAIDMVSKIMAPILLTRGLRRGISMGFVFALAAACPIFSQAAQAAPTDEVFSAIPEVKKTNAKPPNYQVAPNAVAAPGAMAMYQPGPTTPEVRCMEAMDEIVYQGHPTVQERITLQTPFNQNPERVRRWVDAARAVSKRYHMTAKQLRLMTTPASAPDLKTFADSRADWFDDAAMVYEDMFKPVRAARTIEELDSKLKTVQDRADQLDNQKKTILSADRNLRRKYRVHAPRKTDALTIYVTGDNPQNPGK